MNMLDSDQIHETESERNFDLAQIDDANSASIEDFTADAVVVAAMPRHLIMLLIFVLWLKSFFLRPKGSLHFQAPSIRFRFRDW